MFHSCKNVDSRDGYFAKMEDCCVRYVGNEQRSVLELISLAPWLSFGDTVISSDTQVLKDKKKTIYAALFKPNL